MLELRPNCECCNVDLPPDSTEARICSFECTFCATCAETTLKGRCPNCGGELVTRPRRPADKLVRYPGSTERVRSNCLHILASAADQVQEARPSKADAAHRGAERDVQVFSNRHLAKRLRRAGLRLLRQIDVDRRSV